MARPTKYSEEMQAKAEAYITNDTWKDQDAIPSIEGLAKFLGIARSTIYEWKDDHKALSDTLGEIESEQKRVTLNNGITGEFNSTIAKLVLHNHGFTDKTDVNQTGDLIIRVDGKQAEL